MTPPNPAPAAEPRVVLCMKWGTKYGPEYANRLYAMVRRHLSGDFTFVCLTDDSRGIRPEVRCLPIPEMPLAPGVDRGWPKLTTFDAELHGLRGVGLFVDLDVVIVGSLDELFTHPGEFLIIHDWKRPWRITGNSSVYRYRLGAHGDVLQQFIDNQQAARKRFRNEQEFLTHAMKDRGLLNYWPAAWFPSFKYHCVPRWPFNRWQAPRVPDGAKIVIFHGEVNPPDAIRGAKTRKGKIVLPSPWVSAAWTE